MNYVHINTLTNILKTKLVRKKIVLLVKIKIMTKKKHTIIVINMSSFFFMR